ncbi:MAG TPA: hypothetical protein PLM74_03545 [Bacillota bacterium]|nr:hypothetical protein [Bacillota bacterium]
MELTDARGVMLQVTLPGDTGRADVPLRPEEMDAAAHFIRSQGYSPEHFGLEPVGHSNYMAWPVPADQILPEPGGEHEPDAESTLGVSVDLLVEPPKEPSNKPAAGPEAEPAVEPAVEREPPRPKQAAAPDAQAKPHTIVWKAFPRPRSQ